MNRKMFSALAMAGALALVAATPVWAQAQGSVNATIPFAFNVGTKAFPAVEYEVQRLIPNTLAIRNLDTKECALALAMNGAPEDMSEDAKLVFHQYGDSIYLSQVWTWDVTRTLPISKSERRAASRAAESASNAPVSRSVYVAAREQ
jgi:hypothetical protein